MFLPIWIDEIGKNRDKSMNETSVSSISTDWSNQSISIKSDLPIFVDLSIDKSISIFIDWPLRDFVAVTTRLQREIPLCDALWRT